MATVVFAGTPGFAVPSLMALGQWCRAEGHALQVMTQPDRPAGRGRKLAMSEVKQCALEQAWPIWQPDSLKNLDTAQQLNESHPLLMVVAAYGMLLPKSILQIPALGCINVHASLLPRWRGAAPIQRAVEAGDRYTGVSIMQMTAGLDEGPVWLQRSCVIQPNDTAASVHDRVAALGASALLSALPAIESGDAYPVKQIDAFATYAKKLSKQEAPIDWQQPATQIVQQIQAFNPYPVATTQVGDETVRIWRAELVEAQSDVVAAPGDVLAQHKQGIDLATGRGVVRVVELQRPGKRRMQASQWQEAGTRFA